MGDDHNMKKSYVIMMLLLLSVILCACPEKKMTSKLAENAGGNTPTTSTPIYSPQPTKLAETYYGKWKIISKIGYGYISSAAYSENDYIGVEINISESSIIVHSKNKDRKINKPKFEKKTLDDNKLYKEYGVFFENLTINDDKVTSITVLKDDELWDEFGGKFIIKDDDHLIFRGPMFFLAEKV